MVVVLGGVLVLIGVALAVQQAQRATSAAGRPLRLKEASAELPDPYRRWSSVGIAAALFSGALLLGHGQPRWLHYVLVVGVAVLTLVVQAVALRLVAPSHDPGGVAG
ncbi:MULTISPECIES: hypothetical protein [unclassified Modestobacter]|uniref:hypothetical protein n=1 Tax=unclassified Modestobacter TaxID=2643866 RepID=UPI0022AA2B34|nr:MULTISPECIES: hypothetical protein [unclassified Modestobacter]MCZ2825400.1 hypothetical protein [Modestobacter sp. VKM Ac-2981]MCZ2853535.1 hypothetical protein [Modestobacter sp. VKM Ac-2982]